MPTGFTSTWYVALTWFICRARISLARKPASAINASMALSRAPFQPDWPRTAAWSNSSSSSSSENGLSGSGVRSLYTRCSNGLTPSQPSLLEVGIHPMKQRQVA